MIVSYVPEDLSIKSSVSITRIKLMGRYAPQTRATPAQGRSIATNFTFWTQINDH